MKYLIFLSIYGVCSLITAQKKSISQKFHVSQNTFFGVTDLNIHKKQFLGGITVGYGNFGTDYFQSSEVFPSYLFHEKTYPTFNNYQYELEDYHISNRGISIGIKAETNWKKEKNGIILGINASLYFIKETLNVTHSFPRGIAKPTEEDLLKKVNYIILHKNLSMGVYLGYKRALNRKISLDFIINFPYYFPLHTEKYYIFGVEYLMVGLEPNLSLGINYIIKK